MNRRSFFGIGLAAGFAPAAVKPCEASDDVEDRCCLVTVRLLAELQPDQPSVRAEIVSTFERPAGLLAARGIRLPRFIEARNGCGWLARQGDRALVSFFENGWNIICLPAPVPRPDPAP